jgi:hypothetical protein
MEKKAGQLTHDEIWDDSALVDSWNEALEEYKKYHSIHAKGGSLKDLEEAALAGSSSSSVAKGNPQGNDTEAGPDETEADELHSTGGGGVDLHRHQAPSTANAEATSTNEMQGVAPMAPPLLMGSVRDEGLKKLLMSWYYAGYYTGLYEGQQQAAQAPPKSS